jgi:cytochrome c oxidase cbb3-type subunit 3
MRIAALWLALASLAAADGDLAGARAQKAGEKLFRRECAACHGGSAEGATSAPPLRSPYVEQAAPGVLFSILRDGRLRRGMPSFSHLPPQQRWQIIEYLKSLGPGPH